MTPSIKTWLIISLIINFAGIVALAGVIWWMGGLEQVLTKFNRRGLSQEYELMRNQLAMLPTDSVDILLLGNSLTNHGAWEEWLPGYSIANRGISGEGIEGLTDRLEDYQALAPGLVFTMIGINDLFYHEPSWLKERFPTLLARLQKTYPQSKLVFQSILPVNNSVMNTGLSNQSIAKLNKELEALVKENGHHFLDLSNGFQDSEGNLKSSWTNDGLHLNGPAYQFWAGQIRKIAEQIGKE
ncbi:MAG: hypothetical protein HKN16_06620 [Saprospiraceae bacterium]|nr:hypothetical protein [Saprospiraceae bacterium]